MLSIQQNKAQEVEKTNYWAQEGIENANKSALLVH